MISPVAYSADWTLVSSSKNGEDEYYVDRGSLVKKNGFSKVWLKVVSTKDGLEYTSSKALMEFDCKNNKQRYLMLNNYNIDGKVTFSDQDDKQKFRYVVPESISEGILEYSCKI